MNHEKTPLNKVANVRVSDLCKEESFPENYNNILFYSKHTEFLYP